ncbi:hypothetical protein [Halococcus salsus]|uniref:hypothetical protein n=1 Tax=Halococcus salsus TaxID=2162894 RepID=UPI00135A25BB|nr:hypothetical protein [Halococcus salsus]
MESSTKRRYIFNRVVRSRIDGSRLVAIERLVTTTRVLVGFAVFASVLAIPVLLLILG